MLGFQITLMDCVCPVPEFKSVQQGQSGGVQSTQFGLGWGFGGLGMGGWGLGGLGMGGWGWGWGYGSIGMVGWGNGGLGMGWGFGGPGFW